MPAETVHRAEPVSRGSLVAASALTIFSGVIYAGISFTARGVQELLRGFGTELPLLTRVVVAIVPYVSVLVVVGLVPTLWLFRRREVTPRQRNLVIFLSAMNVVLALGILALCLAAFYLPIFKLGAG